MSDPEWGKDCGQRATHCATRSGHVSKVAHLPRRGGVSRKTARGMLRLVHCPTGEGVAAAGGELPPLDGLLEEVRRATFARVPEALTPPWRVELLAEVDRRRFCPVAEQVGRVRQRAEELVVPVGEAGYPVTALLAAALHDAVSRRSPRLPGLERFVPNEAVYLRYRGPAAGISPHRDHKRYVVLIAVFTLLGGAPFSVVADRAGEHVLASWLTAPGDLFLLRASGFGGDEDGCPLHAVGPPTGHERVSLTLRMDTRLGNRPGSK